MGTRRWRVESEEEASTKGSTSMLISASGCKTSGGATCWTEGSWGIATGCEKADTDCVRNDDGAGTDADIHVEVDGSTEKGLCSQEDGGGACPHTTDGCVNVDWGWSWKGCGAAGREETGSVVQCISR